MQYGNSQAEIIMATAVLITSISGLLQVLIPVILRQPQKKHSLIFCTNGKTPSSHARGCLTLLLDLTFNQALAVASSSCFGAAPTPIRISEESDAILNPPKRFKILVRNRKLGLANHKRSSEYIVS